jgi:hypothetical protein
MKKQPYTKEQEQRAASVVAQDRHDRIILQMSEGTRNLALPFTEYIHKYKGPTPCGVGPFVEGSLLRT